MTQAKSIVVLTGAGISAESGIRTFRDAGGLWDGHRPEDVAHPDAFARDSELVHRFYNLRRQQLQHSAVQPNPAHFALAELDKKWAGNFLLVTQNVDDLHERAGSLRLLHMHGELNRARCQSCRRSFVWLSDLSAASACPGCRQSGVLRPDIVWFSEMPYHMEDVFAATEACDLFLSIGTSGHVYPAAGLASLATRAHRIELNLEKSMVSNSFHEHRVGPASVEVPKVVEDMLGGYA